MPSHRVNKWIFGTALTAVISLPLIIPGCTPISGNDPIGAMFGISGESNPNVIIAQTMVQPILDMVNQQAQVDGQAPTLEEIVAMGNDNTGQQLISTSVAPTYIINGDHIDLTLNGSTEPFCKIFIENNLAVLKC